MLLCVFFINFIGTGILYSQKTFQPKTIDVNWKGIIYRQERTLDFNLHPNGYSIGYSAGKIETYYRTKYYHFDIGVLRDPRQYNQNKNIPGGFAKIADDFHYGKQNHVYTIKAGRGTKKLVSDKARRRGVALGYNFMFGPTIAILRPYYLELIYVQENDGRFRNSLVSEKYSKANQDKFLDINSIYGSSKGKGWGELDFVPGVQSKLGFFFSPGAFEKIAKSLEIGIMGDLYLRSLPIMVATENISNKPYFINLYVHLELGKRSN